MRKTPPLTRTMFLVARSSLVVVTLSFVAEASRNARDREDISRRDADYAGYLIDPWHVTTVGGFHGYGCNSTRAEP